MIQAPATTAAPTQAPPVATTTTTTTTVPTVASETTPELIITPPPLPPKVTGTVQPDYYGSYCHAARYQQNHTPIDCSWMTRHEQTLIIITLVTSWLSISVLILRI